ncbi:MAG: ECF transporter S component [Caldiserica bacterium]|nr:ECF transporter S component [Caldisericota bacterium]
MNDTTLSCPNPDDDWPVASRWVAAANGVSLPVRSGRRQDPLPMHYAVLLGGLLLGLVAGTFLGITTPVLSTLMTGMPAVAILLPMVVELAVYGLVAGVGRRQRRLVPIWSLLLAMAAGRIALGLVVALLGPLIGLKAEPVAYVVASVVTGLPGIAVQVAVIPLLLVRGRLERSVAQA